MFSDFKERIHVMQDQNFVEPLKLDNDLSYIVLHLFSAVAYM